MRNSNLTTQTEEPERIECNCKDHARTFQETNNGKLPTSDHAPTCNKYKLEKFCKIRMNETSTIIEARELLTYLENLEDEDGECCVKLVHMTRDQFERLPETQSL